jgi:hypothetical protein
MKKSKRFDQQYAQAMGDEELKRQIRAQLTEINSYKLAKNPLSNAIHSTNDEKDRLKNLAAVQKGSSMEGGVPQVKNITSQFKSDIIIRMNN